MCFTDDGRQCVGDSACCDLPPWNHPMERTQVSGRAEDGLRQKGQDPASVALGAIPAGKAHLPACGGCLPLTEAGGREDTLFQHATSLTGELGGCAHFVCLLAHPCDVPQSLHHAPSAAALAHGGPPSDEAIEEVVREILHELASKGLQRRVRRTITRQVLLTCCPCCCGPAPRSQATTSSAPLTDTHPNPPPSPNSPPCGAMGLKRARARLPGCWCRGGGPHASSPSGVLGSPS